MPVTPQDILNVAKELRKTQTEPFLRSSVSRAYYAAYTAAREICPPLTPRIQAMPVGSHEKVIQALLTHAGEDKPDVRLVGELLKRMKPDRHVADYQLCDPVADTLASTAIERSQQALATIGIIRRRRQERAPEQSA
jgi:uncharacterized protein (UPF0332 family)